MDLWAKQYFNWKCLWKNQKDIRFKSKCIGLIFLFNFSWVWILEAVMCRTRNKPRYYKFKACNDFYHNVGIIIINLSHKWAFSFYRFKCISISVCERTFKHYLSRPILYNCPIFQRLVCFFHNCKYHKQLVGDSELNFY